ncbi:MAG: hypothetical protein CL910_18045 [Deltaproteobacteria bacterium]|jgi:hypothetical protein|nr:hypothetical protein [Deltaproteobacteria bacterium]
MGRNAARVLLAVGILAMAGRSAMAEETSYVDTHMHLHPVGLDAVMGQGGARGAGMRASDGDRYMGRGHLPGRRGLRGPRGGGTVQAPAKRSDGPSNASGDIASGLAQAADNLVAKMDREGVARALIVLVPSRWGTSEEVERYTRSAVARHPDRLQLMAGGEVLNAMIQETSPKAVTEAMVRSFEDRAEAVIAGGATGFGEMISYHLCMTKGHNFQSAAADHPLFLRLAEVAARRNVPIDLHMEAIETAMPLPERLGRSCDDNPSSLEATVPALERLLAHERRARIVWQHIGWDNTGQMTPALMQRLLKAHPNLYLSFRVVEIPEHARGALSMPNRIVDEQGRITAAWRAVIDSFPDRVMIGADEFVSPSDATARLARSFDATWSILGQLPSDAARQVGGENAARVYRLK